MQTNENVSSPSPLRYFISRLLILFGMSLLFYFLFSGITLLLLKPVFGINSLSALIEFETNPVALQAMKFMQVFISIGAMVLPALIFTWMVQQERFTFLKLNSFFSFKHFLLMISLLVFSIPFLAWLVHFNGNIHFPSVFSGLEQTLKDAEISAEQMTKAFMRTTTLSGFAVNLVVIALVPAISEELFFRGALQQLIKMCFDKRHLAVWISAIIFSGIHFQFFGFFPRMVLGLFLGYLFEYSGSMWLNVSLHF
ncbi:MAG: CPBP family intramembrane glutamic endopeptidase, partial [Bacteroidia bacterium]